ncbi:hypothetical protein BASA62_003387 [Batrachochytrium salamandrivorans]|nr:hypothetical protein BASA62_003387 [Batrachochytrium salamandrivorans]
MYSICTKNKSTRTYVYSSKLFGPALTLILALVSSAVIALPTVNNVYKHAVASFNPLSTELPFHFSESVYESILYDGDISSFLFKEDDVNIATDYIYNKLNLGAGDFKVFDSFTDSAGVTHVYGAHMVNDIRIANHHASAHVKNGQVVSFSSSFGTAQHFSKRDLIISEPKATVDFERASATASAQLDIPVYSEFEHVLEYVEQPDGNVVYAYKLQLRNNPLTKWVQVWCDATTGEVIQTIDFANKASCEPIKTVGLTNSASCEPIQTVDPANGISSYKVIALPRRDPTEGFSMVYNPEFKGSSPNGWTDGEATKGNNAIISTTRGKTILSTSKGVFDTQFNSTANPRTTINVAAAAVNLFYLVNLMHDISYQYGFTEQAGNFQKDNFGKGGKGGDAVIVNAIHAYENNGANFFTPVDGKSPVMTMYGFTNSIPNRSGGLDNGIAIHEYVHGISLRLTGGPTASGCLDIKEAQGLSEGWSDVIAMIVLARSSDTATTSIPMGAYVTNKPGGIRSHPYTTDMTVNPLTYSDLQTRNDPHPMGEVWASLLWEVYWSLVTKHGFSTNLYDAKQSEGNIVTMQIIIGGMMLQPCNPTFLSARDAIVAADASYYKGANKCEILKAFAKRGLGSKATNSYSNDFSVPSECDGSTPPVKQR